MDAATSRAIEAECTRTMLQQVSCLDERRYAELVTLFTPDGIWRRDGRTLVGRDAILEAVRARPAHWIVRHVASNLLTRLVSAERTDLEMYLTAYLHDGPAPPNGTPVLSGPFRFVVVRASLVPFAAGWAIAEQTNIRQFEFKTP